MYLRTVFVIYHIQNLLYFFSNMHLMFLDQLDHH